MAWIRIKTIEVVYSGSSLKESADKVKNDSKIFSLSLCKLKSSCIKMKTVESEVWGMRNIRSFGCFTSENPV